MNTGQGTKAIAARVARQKTPRASITAGRDLQEVEAHIYSLREVMAEMVQQLGNQRAAHKKQLEQRDKRIELLVARLETAELAEERLHKIPGLVRGICWGAWNGLHMMKNGFQRARGALAPA